MAVDLTRMKGKLFTRMHQQKVALCKFTGDVTWPVCIEEKRIGWSDIVSNQPAFVNKHTEHAESFDTPSYFG